MVLYGGQNADGSITDQNVYVLRIVNGTPTWTTATLTAGSPVPAARSRHAMASDLKATGVNGIAFGGVKSGGQLSDELWEFTVDALDRVTWKLWPPNGPAPAARAGGSIILYEEHPRSFVLVGGELASGTDAKVWEFRRDTNSWSEHPTLPNAITGQVAFREHRVLTPLEPELYDPATNAWSDFGDTKKRQSYHMIFTASDGKLYSPGPNQSLKDSTWVFNPTTGQWALYARNATLPLDDTVGGILYRPDQLMKCGGLTTYAFQGHTFSLPTGLSGPATPWRESVNKMAFSRTDHILSMLPTGEIIATGGVGKADNKNANPYDDDARTRPQIWDPTFEDPAEPLKLGGWYGSADGVDTLAAEPVTRGHHSSAVILPDGRILSGGGWDLHPSTVQKSVDQFSPPYLFQPNGDSATRPQLYGAQDRIKWDETFEVSCPDPVAFACLIRPGATTHAFNQDCRYVPLDVVSQTDHRVTLRLPLTSTVHTAPPGNYLLFVLRNDNGRKVPSIARWVNVASAKSSYTTWDIDPPSTITNLSVWNYTGTSLTLQWTAPADAGYGSSGKAKRYEVRYRAAIGMADWNTFIDIGRPIPGLPSPGNVNDVQTVNVTGLSPDTVYYFRIVSRDGAGSDRNWSALSNQAETPTGGGCPYVDTRTAGGWMEENTILGRSLTGAMSLDGYRLKHAPEVRGGRVRLRVRENEQERTTLDQVRLVAVDHAPGGRAFPMGDEILVGTPTPAARVTTAAGVDVTAAFSGEGEGFAGGPGDTLLVEFGSAEHAVIGEERATQHHEPYHEGDGGKCPPDCGYPLKTPADPYSATAIDAQVLGSSGIQIQTSDGLGGWRTVLTRYPREHADEAVFDGVPHGPVRLVFVGRHTVRSLGRLHATPGGFAVSELPLLEARHTRFGDVAAALDKTGSVTSELSPGDTVNLEFGWTPVPEGQVRELMLLSHGVYTAALPASNQQVLPARFALRLPQPNPFATSSTLHFDLPRESHVRLEVLDAQGRRIRVLANHRLPPGSHSIEWDGSADTGSRAGPGVYFYRFSAGEHRAQGRLVHVP